MQPQVKDVHKIKLMEEDDSVVLAYNRNNYFEEDSINFMLSCLNRDSVLIDVRAYTGIYSLIASKHSKRVYAFEPTRTAYNRLLKNIELNDVDNVVAINAAIHNCEETEKRLYFTSNTNLNHSVSFEPEQIEEEYEDVKVLNSLYFKETVSCIKIDADRSVLNVIEVLDHVIDRDRPKLIIETMTDVDEIRIMRYLSKYGYRFETKDKRNLICY